MPTEKISHRAEHKIGIYCEREPPPEATTTTTEMTTTIKAKKKIGRAHAILYLGMGWSRSRSRSWTGVVRCGASSGMWVAIFRRDRRTKNKPCNSCSISRGSWFEESVTRFFTMPKLHGLPRENRRGDDGISQCMWVCVCVYMVTVYGWLTHTQGCSSVLCKRYSHPSFADHGPWLATHPLLDLTTGPYQTAVAAARCPLSVTRWAVDCLRHF